MISQKLTYLFKKPFLSSGTGETYLLLHDLCKPNKSFIVDLYNLPQLHLFKKPFLCSGTCQNLLLYTTYSSQETASPNLLS